ncbi:MAG: cation transporter [Cyanobacteria bacterium P01_F01_bin.42]
MNTVEETSPTASSNLFVQEAKAIHLGAVGGLCMAVLGLGFAVLTKSEAILLDGFFSLIGFAVSLLTQKVARLAVRPADQQYPFGYAAFEPMLNLSKGLLTGLIGLFAMISAISALFTGGRPISSGMAIAYAVVDALGCFLFAWRIGVLAKRSKSTLAKVDAQNWMIGGLISVAVAITFLVVTLIQSTSLAGLTPYADPAIVIVLVLFMIPIPLKLVRDAWRQIVGYRPDSQKMAVVNSAIAQIFSPADSVTWQIRSLEVGRIIYVQVYVLDPEQWSGDLARQDRLRHQLHSRLTQQFTCIKLDVIFTKQQEWLNWSV